jgi:hypothetical protein
MRGSRFRGFGNGGKKHPAWIVKCSYPSCTSSEFYSLKNNYGVTNTTIIDHFQSLGWTIADNSHRDMCPYHTRLRLGNVPEPIPPKPLSPARSSQFAILADFKLTPKPSQSSQPPQPPQPPPLVTPVTPVTPPPPLAAGTPAQLSETNDLSRHKIGTEQAVPALAAEPLPEPPPVVLPDPPAPPPSFIETVTTLTQCALSADDLMAIATQPELRQLFAKAARLLAAVNGTPMAAPSVTPSEPPKPAAIEPPSQPPKAADTRIRDANLRWLDHIARGNDRIIKRLSDDDA